MNILVLMKQTFDTEEKIVLEAGQIKQDGVQYTINPYDEYAIEEALLIRDVSGGEITVMTLGPVAVEESLRKAIAMGVDHGIHILTETNTGDEYKTATLLAEALRTISYDIILCGNQTIDNGSGQVAVRVAELLGIPHISTVTKLAVEGERVVAHRDAEGDIEIVESSLPVLITAQQGLNEPRYPSLLGIRKASKAPVNALQERELDSQAAPKKKIVATFLPKVKAAGRILEGDTQTRVTELIGFLHREEKVI